MSDGAEKQSVSRNGGRRPGAGRKPGKKNARTIEIEQKAREHTAEALKALLYIAKNGKSEPARVSAATALLDRGYGRPRQAVEHTGEGGGPVHVKVTHQIIDASK